MTELAGTGTLIRLILRRDWLKFLIYVALVSLIPIGLAASFIKLYPTAQALKDFADLSMSTSATIGMLGFVYSPTVGGLVAWRAGLNGIFFIVPVSILFVIRHTRTEEEAGRRELLGGSVLGRFASLIAALTVVFCADLLIGALIADGLIGQGLPAAGSITYGLSEALAGWVFASFAAVAAQLTESPGPARAMVLAVFGFFWIMRAAGDLGGAPGAEGWLSWLSPLGWVRLTRAFAGEQVWVLGLSLGLVILLVAGAFALSARRDLGAGLLPARLGPAVASPALRNPLALAWRLQRDALLGWCVGAAVFGYLLGNVGVGISKFVDTPQMQQWAIQMGARNAGDAFLYLVIYTLGQVVSAYAITAALSMRSEETAGHADPILAAPVSRLRWMGSHLFFAVLNSTILLGVLGLTIGLGYGLGAGSVIHELPRLLARSMLTLPAIWVMVGIATLLFGLLPRFATAGTWAALGIFLALELGWELRQISQQLFNISPFAHVHWAIQVTAAPLIGLTLLAAVLMAFGMLGFSRRDIG
jgi:ABC-2 type transport system permease protein